MSRTARKPAARVELAAPTAEWLDARDELDHWEHYADHAGFIAECGGQAAYDREHTRRFRAFMRLDMRSAK
jgi:hypothetical protein